MGLIEPGEAFREDPEIIDPPSPAALKYCTVFCESLWEGPMARSEDTAACG